MLSVEFNDDFGKHCRIVTSQAAKLRSLADAFYMTGNETMATRLENISVILEETEHQINGSYSKGLGETIKAVDQASNNIMRACLVGLTGSIPSDA